MYVYGLSNTECYHRHYKSYILCLTAKIRRVSIEPVSVFAHSYSLGIGTYGTYSTYGIRYFTRANMISRVLETVANKLKTPHWRRW